MLKTGRISDIRVASATSWEGKRFFTFDIDWACDDLLSWSIDLVAESGVAATWFVTHATPQLERLRANPLWELGIHPNFNGLLEGKATGGASDVVKNLLDIVPEARAVRCHSLTQSSHLLDLFQENGLTHEANILLPCHSGMKACPWTHWNGMARIPHVWEDDVWLIEGRSVTPPTLLAADGLVVLDFHPIHLALNCYTSADYENSRRYHRDWVALQPWRRQGEGVRWFFDALTKEVDG